MNSLKKNYEFFVEIDSFILPIPTKCENCKVDITEILSCNIFVSNNINLGPSRTEYYCKCCVTKSVNNLDKIDYKDIIKSGIKTIFTAYNRINENG